MYMYIIIITIQMLIAHGVILSENRFLLKRFGKSFTYMEVVILILLLRYVPSQSCSCAFSVLISLLFLKMFLLFL